MTLDFAGNARFAIRRRLGQGGMGVVYEAHDRELEATVALKTLIGLDPAAIYRFKREFRALADVSHPNLVALHELFAEEGKLFFTMDLVEGVDFIAHVREHEAAAYDATVAPGAGGAGGPGEGVIIRVQGPAVTVDVDRVRDGVRQLAEGVLALHEAGKLHRDLKPSNVLVTREGRVVILDFGLVSDRMVGGLDATAEGAIMGTPAYMSPEQASGKRARPSSDWYAVGGILYEALSGALPFTGSPHMVVVGKQLRDAPSLRAVAPHAPDDLVDLCAALLSRNPEARPSGEEVLRRLGATRVTSAAPAAPPRFVGRASELRQLAQLQKEAAAGKASLALVHGRSGMGKSALVHHFLDELGSDVVVLTGRCYERESVPYKAFDSLVDGLTAHLLRLPDDEVIALLPREAGAIVRLFPVLRRVEVVPATSAPQQGEQRELLARACGALRALFGAIARRAPLVLALEDLQWADADSAHLLSALLAPPAPPLFVVGTYRSEDVAESAVLREIVRMGSLGIELSPLSDAETEELARALLPGDPGAAERARAISREAGGVPFFVGELARFRDEVRSGDREPSLDRVVALRLSRLPAEARRMLELLAVAGRPTSQRILIEASGSPDAHGALRTLRVEGLIRAQGARESVTVEAYHDRIREGALAAIDPASLRDHHLRLAAALSAAGADAEVLAEHHAGGGDLGRAADLTLVAAGAAAEALAFHRAARLYARRIAFDEQRGVRDVAALDALRVQLADALVQCGRGPEAARAYLEAASRAAPEAAIDLRRRAAEQLLISGHLDEGLAALDGVLRAAGLSLQSSPKTALISFLARAAQLRIRGLGFRERAEAEIDRDKLARIDACFTAATGLTFADAIRASDFQARHLIHALDAGEPARIALGLCNYAALLAADGGSARPRVDALLATATSLAKRLDHPHALGRSRMAAGTAAFFQGRFADGLAILDEAERIFRERCTGVAWEIDGTELWARLALIWKGDLRELHRRADEELRDARARGDRFAETWILACAVPHGRLAADDPRGARAAVAEALAAWRPQPFLAIHFLALWHDALVDLYEGDAAAALSRLNARWPEVERSLLLRIQICRVILVWMRGLAAVLTAGRDPRGKHLSAAERDASSLAGERMPYAEALSLALRAEIAAARGQKPAALDLGRKAVARLDEQGMALHAAAARRALSARTPDEAEARALGEAVRAYAAAQGIQRPERFFWPV